MAEVNAGKKDGETRKKESHGKQDKRAVYIIL